MSVCSNVRSVKSHVRGGGSFRHTWNRIGKSTANTVTKQFPTIVGTVTQLSALVKRRHSNVKTHRVQMNLVKTAEGHIGFFPSNELRNDLHCTHCDFLAISSSKLKRHMLKHNPKPPKAEEKCPKCDMTFKYKSDLERHIPTSHRDYVKGNSRSNVTCDQCSYACALFSALRRHNDITLEKSHKSVNSVIFTR